MVSQRILEKKRVRSLKLSKNIERLYKEGKCRDCSIVVTRMDFAKILGKFTKVKIQYESSSTPKTKKNPQVTSPNSNARLKSNENGMVLIHRKAYTQHPVKELITPKKVQQATPRTNNVLKENNRLKKTSIVKDKNSNFNITRCNEPIRKNNLHLKQYGIIFVDPSSKKKNDFKSKISLLELLPSVDKSILPSDQWCIDYLPRNEEPKNDKVYDRIAAELEDLMYNEKPVLKLEDSSETSETKVDDFPSIMDILNDNSSETSKPNDQSVSIDYKPSVESSDVEAMLLGKTVNASKELESTAMDTSDMSNLIEDVAQLHAIQVDSQGNTIKIPEPIVDEIENPHSPSILDEALQKGIEEHLPLLTDSKTEGDNVITENHEADGKSEQIKTEVCKVKTDLSLPSNITHLIFKKNVNGECVKCVTCPKNLQYAIELDGKTVEFLGAPQFISSLDDLQVLLQIVNETELKNLYVYH